MRKYILYLFCLVLIVNGCDRKQEPTIITSPIGKPTIESISPSSVIVGSDITIQGTNFNPDSTKISVLVDGQKCKISFIKSTVITVILPTNLIPGYKKITIKQDDYIVNSDSQFEVYAFPQSVTLESTTALIGDKVKITVNDLHPAFNCKITGYINGKEIEAKKGSSFKEFFISIDQAGSVELRINSIPVKGVSITVYDPNDLITLNSWTVDKVDFWVNGNPNYFVKGYEGIIGKFVFNKDGSYTRIENGRDTKGIWKIEKNLNFSTDKYMIRLKETENDWLGFLRESYSELEKMTLDSLVFNCFGTLVRSIPSDKVPTAQEIPNSTIEELLTRPKLWAEDIQKGVSVAISIGLDIKFLVSSSLWVHTTYGDFKEREWFWAIENESGKNILKITQIANDGTPYITSLEIEEINFNKLVLKNSQNYKAYYRPRYW